MGKYIVMDIVFYGSSLNYDQGTGNYQELKKITKWDGKQYTLVSRYALRYSLLKTAEDLGLWKNAPAQIFRGSGKGEKTVIQPSVDALLSGELLTYPEFDLFGYLITDTAPQNSREAPVKISHAISMTPYTYDSHFAGNIGLAKRMVEGGTAEKMDANLFTIEEHQTYYIYTVVIDVDRIGKCEVYIAKKDGLQPEFFGSAKDEAEGNTHEDSEESEEEPAEKKGKGKSVEIEEIKKEGNKIIIRLKNKKGREVNINQHIEAQLKTLNNILYCIEFSLAKNPQPSNEELTPEAKRIVNLVKAILNLNRSIKARPESLRPKLLVLGLYENQPYQTFKDKIVLGEEYEEIYEEHPENTEKGGVKIVRRTVKLNRPVFKIFAKTQIQPQHLDDNTVLQKIKDFLNLQSQRGKETQQENSPQTPLNIFIFKDTGIEVRLDTSS